MLLTLTTFSLLAQAPLWSCDGQPPVPPGEAVAFEVGFAAEGRSADLVEQARLEGISRLNRRFCPQASEDCTMFLRREIVSGVSGRSAQGSCIYVPTSQPAWKASRAVTEFEEQLLPRVRLLLEKAGHSAVNPLTVRVGLVEDARRPRCTGLVGEGPAREGADRRWSGGHDAHARRAADARDGRHRGRRLDNRQRRTLFTVKRLRESAAGRD